MEHDLQQHRKAEHVRIGCRVHICRHWDFETEDCAYCRLCKGSCHDAGHREYGVFGAQLAARRVRGELVVVCSGFETLET